MGLVQGDQIGIGHVDLAPSFQQGGRIAARQAQRQAADRADIMRHVIPDAAVAPRRAAHQQSVLVDQRDGHSIDLQFHHPLDLLARQQLLRPLAELPQFVDAVGVFDREHGHAVRYLLQSRDRLIADPPRGAVGRGQFRVFGLERLQPLHEAVVVQVADFRRGLDVVLLIVVTDLLSEPVDFSGGVRGHMRDPMSIVVRWGGSSLYLATEDTEVTERCV